VLQLKLETPADRPTSILAVGAHPDDIEIGAGGTLLSLAASEPSLEVYYLVLTGTAERQIEATQAANAVVPGASLTIDLRDLAEGRFPAIWADVKDALEEVARIFSPDLVLGPTRNDAHQDHRTIGEILPTVFRDALHLGYEIPKWDGDFAQPSVYVPLSADIACQKVELLNKCFTSQRGRDWWDDEMFLGLARLRGMECRERYAEAFTCTKSVVVASHLTPRAAP
jgi:LmbE family N-acetylglucosaminyl deacetylase